MPTINELRELAKSSHSQSWVSLDIVTFLNLLDVVEAADAFMEKYCFVFGVSVFGIEDAHKGELIQRFKDALKALENS